MLGKGSGVVEEEMGDGGMGGLIIGHVRGNEFSKSERCFVSFAGKSGEIGLFLWFERKRATLASQCYMLCYHNTAHLPEFNRAIQMQSSLVRLWNHPQTGPDYFSTKENFISIELICSVK